MHAHDLSYQMPSQAKGSNFSGEKSKKLADVYNLQAPGLMQAVRGPAQITHLERART